jgi:hypothetical protein
MAPRRNPIAQATVDMLSQVFCAARYLSRPRFGLCRLVRLWRIIVIDGTIVSRTRLAAVAGSSIRRSCAGTRPGVPAGPGYEQAPSGLMTRFAIWGMVQRRVTALGTP